MARNTAPTGTSSRKPDAATPRQVALVVPHAAVDAGATFESALEIPDQDLRVHKLWQEAKTPAKRPA